MTNKTAIARLNYLADRIARYAHRYDVSLRVHNWIDEYNDLKAKHYDGAWQDYCEARGFDTSHNGHDALG